MNKYDNMIEKNRKVSEEKIARAIIRVSSERNGEAGAFFTQVHNLERVRVIVD